MSSNLFRKVLILNGKSRKTYFICKCLVQPELPSEDLNNSEVQNVPAEIYCNVKHGTFKGMIRHLTKKHKVFLPSAIVCDSCQIVLQNTCQSVAHYKLHLEQALEIFNYEDEEFPCDSCSNNRNLIKMIRSGLSCDL